MGSILSPSSMESSLQRHLKAINRDMPRDCRLEFDDDDDDDEEEAPNSTSRQVDQGESKTEDEIERGQSDEDPMPVAIVTTTPVTSKRKKPSPKGRTTARKKRKTKTATRIGEGCRVYVARENVFSLLEADEQKQRLRTEETQRRSYRVYGTVITGSARNGYCIEFDILPANQKRVRVDRANITLVKEGEEKEAAAADEDGEPSDLLIDEAGEKTKKKQKQDPYRDTMDAFCAQSEDVLKRASFLNWEYGKGGVTNTLTWKISHLKILYLRLPGMFRGGNRFQKTRKFACLSGLLPGLGEGDYYAWIEPSRLSFTDVAKK